METVESISVGNMGGTMSAALGTARYGNSPT